MIHGEIGHVIADDRTERPFHVELLSGENAWFPEDDVQRIERADTEETETGQKAETEASKKVESEAKAADAEAEEARVKKVAAHSDKEAADVADGNAEEAAESESGNDLEAQLREAEARLEASLAGGASTGSAEGKEAAESPTEAGLHRGMLHLESSWAGEVGVREPMESPEAQAETPLLSDSRTGEAEGQAETPLQRHSSMEDAESEAVEDKAREAAEAGVNGGVKENARVESDCDTVDRAEAKDEAEGREKELFIAKASAADSVRRVSDTVIQRMSHLEASVETQREEEGGVEAGALSSGKLPDSFQGASQTYTDTFEASADTRREEAETNVLSDKLPDSFQDASQTYADTFEESQMYTTQQLDATRTYTPPEEHSQLGETWPIARVSHGSAGVGLAPNVSASALTVESQRQADDHEDTYSEGFEATDHRNIDLESADFEDESGTMVGNAVASQNTKDHRAVAAETADDEYDDEDGYGCSDFEEADGEEAIGEGPDFEGESDDEDPVSRIVAASQVPPAKAGSTGSVDSCEDYEADDFDNDGSDDEVAR
jgi:hypothetical protein